MIAPRIWIDLDNAPHAHFFAPIVRDLQRRGSNPVLTLRSFGQTEALARSYGMEFTAIGAHCTHLSRPGRIAETFHRAAQLVDFAIAQRPAAAVSHGSRALTLAAALLGIPCMALYDYEHVSAGLFHLLCRRVLLPEILLRESNLNHGSIGYPGFKEDVYIHDFRPDPRLLNKLALDPQRLIVTVRPPATWAHYHNDQSTVLFQALIEHLRAYRDAQILILARTPQQSVELGRDFHIDEPPFRLTADAVDGLSLLTYSDAVFSGGGTMVREAALLGCTAYSTFAGKSGAIDRELERLGKLVILRTPDDISRLRLQKPARSASPSPDPGTRDFILNQILDLAHVRTHTA